MNEAGAVDILLDLRAYPDRLDQREAFLAFWNELEPALVGQRLVEGNSHTLEAGPNSIGLTVIKAPVGGITVSEAVEVSIRAVLEPPALLYVCRLCKVEGHATYGPFVCASCQKENIGARVCDEHVVILDGAMRSACQEHTPQCTCGRAATFWCQGPMCRRQKAWCDQHRQRHPRDPDHSFCDACYELTYPACEQGGCGRVGTLACEHVDTVTLHACGRRACLTHMSRWQVYGPEKEGLTLCTHHRGVARLGDQALVDEIVLGTAMRRLSRKRSPLLPSLQSVRHILRKIRGRIYDLDGIARLFSTFAVNLDSAPSLRRAVLSLLEQHAVRRSQDQSRDQAEKAQGREIFDRLKRVLEEKGQFELAQLVTFSDYRPKINRLFVDLPESHKAKFVGRGGSNIKDLSQRVGAMINIERCGPQGARR